MSKKKDAKKAKKAAKATAKPAMVKKAKTPTGRKRKKRWYGIVAPKEFNNKVIGETLAGEPKELVGRNVNINLMNLLDDYKKQGVNIKFKVEAINDDNGVCKLVGYEILKSHSRRMVRKGTDKMDDSFVAESKDGVKFRIKPVVVTRHRVSVATISDIRKKCRNFISEKIKEMDCQSVFDSVIQSKIQKDLRHDLLKLCPVGACDIRSLEIAN